MDQEYDKLVDVALRYFRYGDSQPFIAESLKTSQSNISKWLSKAEELGIVTHVIDANAAVVADQDRRLSSNLSQAFGLQCDVLDCRSVASSDKLHIALANFAGKKARTQIQSNEHIAIAGGRAMVRLSQVVGQGHVEKFGVNVSSLAGRLYFGLPWTTGTTSSHHLSDPLNADYSTVLLATGLIGNRLDTRIGFTQINRPLYATTPNEADRLKAKYCNFRSGGIWKTIPDRVFAGVGVILPEAGNRIAEFIIQEDQPETTSDVDYKAIKDLVRFANAHNLPAPGDFAHRLFPTLPLPSECVGRGLASLSESNRKLREQAKRVNSRALVVDWEHLTKVRSVTVVAGGTHKAHALWTLLEAQLVWREVTGDPNIGVITELVTDSETAESLIRAKSGLLQGNPEIKHWYRGEMESFLRKSKLVRSKSTKA